MRKAFVILILTGCVGLLAGCQPKAKPVATQPKQEINLIGDLALDPTYDPARSGAGRFVSDREFTNSVGMQMAAVRAGAFRMGSPVDEDGRQDDETQRTVRIEKSFHISVHEVTQKQWKAVMQSQPWHGKPQVAVGDRYPATYITWAEADLFCKVLSRRENRTYRLPTEAEWEYACRAGTTGPYHFDADDLKGHACFEGNADANHPNEVGARRANAWGLHDMHGNVFEWCGDWYGPYDSKATLSPRGLSNGEYRVTRGGSWESMARFCRSAYRAGLGPDARMPTVGFRIVLVRE